MGILATASRSLAPPASEQPVGSAARPTSTEPALQHIPPEKEQEKSATGCSPSRLPGALILPFAHILPSPRSRLGSKARPYGASPIGRSGGSSCHSGAGGFLYVGNVAEEVVRQQS